MKLVFCGLATFCSRLTYRRAPIVPLASKANITPDPLGLVEGLLGESHEDIDMPKTIDARVGRQGDPMLAGS